jgi:divalent metal cation (Fe/Co/Zn/Cd) transporter
MSSVLVRNEQRKLMANYLNSIASATFVGGWLPLFVSWSIGNGRLTEGSIFLMVFAFFISVLIFSSGYRLISRLEEVE